MSRGPLLACRACGAETSEMVEFVGLIEATVSMCDACYDKAVDEFAERRRQFEELIAGGMTREQANAVMIARIDGEAPQ